jgi:site-specific DNA-methyltransferase (adenine-specific)
MDYTLYKGDCEGIMGNMAENSIDLIVTSPPYDNMRHYNNTLTDWNHEKCERIAGEIYRIMKNGGVVVWVVGDKTEGGSETGTSFRQALAFMEKGFLLNDTMIWRKKNPLPQVNQPRYNQVFEYMFVFSKGKPKTFNPITVPCKCAGQVYDSTCKNIGGENGRTKKKFNINKEKVDGNVWDMAIAQNETTHPAVFPLELAERHISSWSNEGDVVLDPFMGSGTTGIAAINMGRKFIGIERNEDYFNMSEKRIIEKAQKG